MVALETEHPSPAYHCGRLLAVIENVQRAALPSVNATIVDRSASRGEMACRGLYVFSHESKLGNAAAHRLFDLIQAPPSASDAPRSFSDYAIVHPPDGPIDGMPGVTLTTLVG